MFWEDKNILIIGASSDIASGINQQIYNKVGRLGLHYNGDIDLIKQYSKEKNIKLFKKNFRREGDCSSIVDEFLLWAGRIDFLIILIGGCKHPVFWEELREEDWIEDYKINLIYPFTIANHAIKSMKKAGGRIIFTGTASAQNAGGSNSLSYGAAKLSLECVMKRLAKDNAKYNILVNMVNPGYIDSKFHAKKMKRTKDELKSRAQFVPLKRAGSIQEVASAYLYLISEDASFITGECINIKGGDWI